MQRWPTKGGLALPIEELGFEVVLPERQKTSQHHLYFRKRLYSRTPIRHLFRNLVDHVQTMQNDDHLDLHRRFGEPVMPREGLMLDVMDEYLALHGVLDFVSEKNTSSVYQLSGNQYQHIKERGVR